MYALAEALPFIFALTVTAIGAAIIWKRAVVGAYFASFQRKKPVTPAQPDMWRKLAVAMVYRFPALDGAVRPTVAAVHLTLFALGAAAVARYGAFGDYLHGLQCDSAQIAALNTRAFANTVALGAYGLWSTFNP